MAHPFFAAGARLQWGFQPGFHLPHIIEEGKGTPIADDAPQDYRRVSQADIYQNVGDKKTRDQFLQLAAEIRRDYEKFEDPDFRAAMESIADYLTAGGRRAQQAALANVKKKVQKCFVRLNKTEEESEIKNAIRAYYDQFCAEKTRFSGDLVTGELVNEGENRNHFRVPNPGGTASGATGVWVSSDDELFPHEPSINDVKEGVGAADCFMLSAIIQMVGSDPKKIKDAMKDNGDGTVTVRFYQSGLERGGQKVDPKPVYITVEKSVNRFFGSANLYASGSLWVQMMEKAYIGYLNQVQHGALSYKSIDYSQTDRFMNAFEGDTVIEHDREEDKHNYVSTREIFGSAWSEDFESSAEKSIFDTRVNGYLEQEKKLYDFLKAHINDGKEVITVGNEPANKTHESFAKDHGVRTQHAYAINKVFEQDVQIGGVTVKKKFVQLRDPYGMFRARYNDKGFLVDDSDRVGGTRNAGTDNMGTFNLELVDFLHCFNTFTGIKRETLADFNKRLDFALNSQQYADLAKCADDPAKTPADLADKEYAIKEDRIRTRNRWLPENQKLPEPVKEAKPEATPETVAQKERLGAFAALQGELDAAVRTTLGVVRTDSAEMQKVKEALKGIAAMQKEPEVKPEAADKAIKALELAARQYINTPGKAHNQRWNLVNALAQRSAEKLQSAPVPAPVQEEVNGLVQKLTDGGINVPERFQNTLQELCRNSKLALSCLESACKDAPEKSQMQVGEAIRQVGVYEALKSSIQSGAFMELEMNLFARKTPDELYRLYDKCNSYLTQHTHAKEWVADKLLQEDHRQTLFAPDEHKLCIAIAKEPPEKAKSAPQEQNAPQNRSDMEAAQDDVPHLPNN